MAIEILKGIKVVQLATFVAAAAAGRYLADYGADVIMVEAKQGDALRFTGAQEGRPTDPRENTTMEYLNGNKRCISLNTKDPAGKQALLDLLATADVLITNWRAPALAKNGLDYDTLKEKFPRLIFAHTTGFGLTGPDKDLPGYDFTAFFARGGYTENLRERGEHAISRIAGLGDDNAGLMLSLGIMTALYNREKTGKGDYVGASLYETAIWNQSIMLLAAQYDGLARTYPIKQRESRNPLNNCFETKDNRLIQLAMPDYDRRIEHFCDVIGRKDLFESGRYFPQAHMVELDAFGELTDNLEAQFKTKTWPEWHEILLAGDIPHSLCYSWMEMLDDPQANALGCYYEVETASGKKAKVTHTPVRLASAPLGEATRCPLIGEQGPDVLKEIGYSDEQLKALEESGAMYVERL